MLLFRLVCTVEGLMMAQGNYSHHHSLAIGGLVVLSLILAVLYPWPAAWRHYRAEPAT